MRFQPGQSGNPGGRPRRAKDWEAALQCAVPSAIQTLVEAMQHGQRMADRIAAARLILERALGKPTEAKPESAAIELPRLALTVFPMGDKDG